jgi:hypothetical protein
VAVEIVPVGETSADAPGTSSVIVHEKDAGAVAVPSDTVTVTLNVPAAVGVPVMTPVDELIVSPVGSPVALNVSVLASGSVAVTDSDTATPVEPD